MKLSRDSLIQLRDAVQRELAYGSERFKDQIEAMTQRRLRPGKPGRPRKELETSSGESVL